MNTHSGGPWRFRGGKRAILKSLGGSLPGASMIPGRLFRRAPILGPVLAWIAGIAIHDLRKPDSRIKAFTRRLLEKRRIPQHIRTLIVPPPAIEGPDTQKQKKKTEEQQ